MQTYFYKIVSKDYNIKDCYVGRTSNFKSRRAVHKSNINNSTLLYKFISSNGGWENWDMLVFEVSTINSKRKLQNLEKQYIENHNATLNIQIPGRTVQQYYQDNLEKRKQQMKTYYYNNKTKCRDLMKKNYKKRQELKKEFERIARENPF